MLCRIRTIAALLALTLVAAVRLSGAELPASLLLNGDFESTMGEPLPGWSRAFYPSGEGIDRCVSISTEHAHGGSHSLKIDTGGALGRETTLVFNGTATPVALALRGRTLELTGWVYVEPGTAVRPISLVLRASGKAADGKIAPLGHVLETKAVGQPGKWTPLRATGEFPAGEITHLDLHCSIRPDQVRTVQFLDDLRLQATDPPSLEVRLLRDAVWDDERVLPVELRLRDDLAGKTLMLRLLDRNGQEIMNWKKAAHSGVFGLELGKAGILEGRYTLRADLGESEPAVAVTPGSLEVTQSPWEDAPTASMPQAFAATPGPAPEGFQVLGTVAPTSADDAASNQVDEVSPDVASAAVRPQGYVVFTRHCLDLASRGAKPWPGEDSPVRLFACAGQYVPAAISVWAVTAQQGLRVRVSDLAGRETSVTAANIDVRVVRTLPGLPPFLEKHDAVSIPSGQTQTFWITLQVPSNVLPGFYRGQIEVTSAEGRPVRRELLLRVLPLTLPPVQKGYGFWWAMDARWKGYYSKNHDEALEQIRKQFVLLREHNCNMVSTPTVPKITKAENDSIQLDFERDHWGHDAYSLADFLRLGRQTHFFSPKVPIQYPGADMLHSDWIARAVKIDRGSPAFDEFYRDICRRIDDWAKQQGYTLAFACVDEIGNSLERREEALRFYRVAQQAGVLTSVTDNSMHAGVHLMGQARFDQWIAMRLYNFITPEMIDDTRRAGDILWLYNLASGGRDARRDRFVFGLFTERCGAAGHAQWAFQFPRGAANDPYEAAAHDGKAGYHYALPSPDGPLPTLALESVREGIDDARYLALLSAEDREEFLQPIEPLSTTIATQSADGCGNRFDVRRWQIARAAMRARKTQP